MDMDNTIIKNIKIEDYNNYNEIISKDNIIIHSEINQIKIDYDIDEYNKYCREKLIRLGLIKENE